MGETESEVWTLSVLPSQYFFIPKAVLKDEIYLRPHNLFILAVSKNWLRMYYIPGTLVGTVVRKIHKIERKKEDEEGEKLLLI